MEKQKNPTHLTSFWQERIYKAVATGGMLHQIILDDSYDLWCYIQSEYAGILHRHIPAGSKVLDAGCGYGALVSCFEEARLDVRYTGVDFSPDLIRLARYRYPDKTFVEAPLEHLPFADQEFDWVIVRSVDGMVIENSGREAWLPMYREVKRVGKRILMGGYAETVGGPIVIVIEEGGVP